jgi:bacterioferritin-associated ferredoxin
MYLCICNAVRESEIDQAVSAGVTKFAEFAARTGCASTCGTCREDAEAMFKQAVVELSKKRREAREFSVPVMAYA